MVENSCCSFCEQLPSLARPGRGSASKCPLCKQALWSTPDGTTHRLGGTNAPASPGKWLRLAGLGVGLLAAIGVAIGVDFTNRHRPAKAPTLAMTSSGKNEAERAIDSLPAVRAKPGWGVRAVRVKPAKPTVVVKPIVEAKSAVKPVPVTYFQDAPTVKPHGPVAALSGVAQDQFNLLRVVPEVDLDPQYAQKTKKDLAQAAEQIFRDTAKDKDAFVVKLRKERGDLAGLPFLLGKDCTIPAKDSSMLLLSATAIRGAMAEASRSRRSSISSQSGERDLGTPNANEAWREIAAEMGKGKLVVRETLPAFRQIMMAENNEHRVLFVAHLQKTKDAKATAVLAEFAVFDADPQVRGAALAALGERPQKDYQPIIMKALRYPWAPVVQNAAYAAVGLEMKGSVAELEALLKEPDPTAPFTVKNEQGKVKLMVRELVRVNHHRNCMLCHAPVGKENIGKLGALPVGPVTAFGDPLPPSSPAYYSVRPIGTLVRADITYLRQDFSRRQKVEDPGRWPEMQRYDFFVRTRELTEEEKIEKRQIGARPEFREAIATALYALTGRDHSSAKAFLPGLSKGPPSKTGR